MEEGTNIVLTLLDESSPQFVQTSILATHNVWLQEYIQLTMQTASCGLASCFTYMPHPLQLILLTANDRIRHETLLGASTLQPSLDH